MLEKQWRLRIIDLSFALLQMPVLPASVFEKYLRPLLPQKTKTGKKEEEKRKKENNSITVPTWLHMNMQWVAKLNTTHENTCMYWPNSPDAIITLIWIVLFWECYTA